MSPPVPSTLDRLAAFSPWPARLLGLSAWQAKTKNPAEITREYEDEKWGPLWRRVQEAGRAVGLGEFLSWIDDPEREEFFSRGPDYFVHPAGEIRKIHLDLIAEALAPYLPAPALVELGCGFGGILLPLGQRFGEGAGQLIGADFTPSAIQLVRYFAAQEKLALQTGSCDLAASGITPLSIPAGAVIYTSYAAHYVRDYTSRLVEDLGAFRPRVVVHFEPVYEHAAVDSLIGQMRRRYIEVNDYNRNLLTILRESEAAGLIRILREEAAVFGRNALLPMSIVAWEPRAESFKP